MSEHLSDCPWSLVVNALADGEVSPEEREAVRAHLTRCAACATQFGNALQLDALARQEDYSSVPAERVALLRGTISHRFRDGVLVVAIQSPRLPSFPSPRTLYLAPDELPGAEVGQRVTLRIEVDNG